MLICEKIHEKFLKNPDKALIGLIFRLPQCTVLSDRLTHSRLGCVGLR